MWLPQAASILHTICNCVGDKSCCNPYTMQADARPGDEKDDAAEDFDVDLKKGKVWRV